MVSSAEIMDLKRIVAKNPKSLAFAWLADLLRVASSGDKQKLDEALLTVNKGLAVNSNFLPGRLARGRILLEKGDLAGANEDFAIVAEQDSFCSSAHKLFLETSEKLGQSLETEVYQKILGTLEPGVVVKVRVKPKTEPKTGVNAALDDLLDEDDTVDDKEDIEISGLLLQTFDNIFEPSKQEPAPPARKSPPPKPDVDALIKEQLSSKVENVPDLTGDMDSLLASVSTLPPVSGALSKPSPPPSPPSPPKSPSPPDVDALIKEQLSSKVENVPDLTSDINSLLASTPAQALPKSPSPPDIDALIKEQLSSKVENVPDLTGDIDSLLKSASAPAQAQFPTLLPTSNTLGSPKSPSPPDIDAIIKEQLSSKIDNAPDLTNDIDSLLESASDVLAASGTLTAPGSPDIDALVKEQLSSKLEDVPDLTGDMNSLLKSEPSLEPSLSASYSLPPISNAPSSPDIDALIKEQLSPKMENVPDLTGDINSLLTSNTPSSPNLDDLIKEQLSSKVEDVPDLTNDINSLLESAPSNTEAEPELIPYEPPTKKSESSLTQKPTLTLAELYMDQGLPHEAAEVYKELIAQDPNNTELKMKLALAEAQM